MIKHIVIWTLKKHADGRSKAENIAIIKQALEALKEKIPVVKKLEIGVNFDPTPDAYDLSLYAEFDSKEDLHTYQNHPEHLKVVQMLKTIRDKKAVVDYTI